MNGDDKHDLRETVGEAVDESVSLELLEALGPMIHGAVHRTMMRWTRIATIGFVLLALASALLWINASRRTDESRAQREEAVELICELNDIAQLLIEDPEIKEQLRKQRCTELLEEVREAR